MNPNSLLFSQKERVVEVQSCGGWSGGAMVLVKHLVPGRPTNLDNRRAKGLLRLQ